VPKTARFRSTMTNNAYMINTTRATFYTHEAACMAQGGHLVSYTSGPEQEVGPARSLGRMVVSREQRR
jgi:hypothetical protein